jgi:predicted O-linked N-acetylglucosamine transferase (SPINDLY family)
VQSLKEGETRPPEGIEVVGPAAQIHQLIGSAVRLHQAGQTAEAERLYEQILAIDPNHVDSLHNLGLIAHQSGRGEMALGLISKAIALNDRHPNCHNTLGIVLARADRTQEAVAHYQKALLLHPEFVEAHVNLGITLQTQGKFDEATEHYQRALALRPGYAKAHHNLGLLFQAQGKLDEAAKQFREALAHDSWNPGAHNNLGLVFQAQGKLDEAVTQFERALSLKRDYIEAYLNLGTALRGQGKLGAAVAQYQQALETAPESAEVHKYLGDALIEQGKLDEAVVQYQRAIVIRPDYADAHNNLGNAHRICGKLEAAICEYHLALSFQPEEAATLNNLGIALRDQGRLDEALIQFEHALAVKPDLAAAFDNLLFCHMYEQRLSPAELAVLHCQWDARYGRAMRRNSYRTERREGRRIKIGYVSGDFRQHSVAWFFEPLLRAHDRQAMEIFCYAEVKSEDEVTQRLKALSEHWRITVGLSDDLVASQIAEDGIDILVDLGGHTAGNRLGVFARKPAPVQVTWLGYPCTTGLSAIDYRLVDSITDPADDALPVASEKLVRLQTPFVCYGPPLDAPPPERPASFDGGPVTFGSFNNPAKLSDATIATWAKLLERLPQARLLLKGRAFADAGTRSLYQARFDDHGIAADRITLLGSVTDAAQHLALYRELDVALDPFPYNGVTTTCEALWMGVPVVTLRGARHSGRVGASLLTSLGLEELIACDVEAYVTIAAEIASARARLTHLRETLRPRMAASLLCDAGRFARNIEAVFIDIWREQLCSITCRIFRTFGSDGFFIE